MDGMRRKPESERLREDLGPWFLPAQTLIEEHAGIAQKGPSALCQDQLLSIQFDQAIVNQRLEKNFRVTALLRLQINCKAGHESKNLLAKAAVLLRQQMASQSRDLALLHAPFVYRKRFFVLVKTCRRFRNRA